MPKIHGQNMHRIIQKAQALNCLELDFFCNKKQDFEALRDNSNPCHDTVQH